MRVRPPTIKGTGRKMKGVFRGNDNRWTAELKAFQDQQLDSRVEGVPRPTTIRKSKGAESKDSAETNDE